ncbi:ras-related protein rab-13 [Anaeramoeba ignava]|uniref:Ras-related protein rab-13 n=1 Tax=Anaeramoeba ignava TaxID=1746090 RepID=A0A9Q0LPE1_ANAIG|nr:ras-related protein rab-13 [Anaeramoeba ignava]
MSFDALYPIFLVGASGVGKTSLIIKYVDDVFNLDLKSNVGIDYITKDVSVEEEEIRLQIWDTAGQEKFQISISSFSIYKNAKAFIIVFDLTNEDSLQEVYNYLLEINNSYKSDILIVLVGNKCDLENQFENLEEKIKEISNEKEFKLFKTSAKEKINVNELFYYIAKTLKEKFPQNENSNKDKPKRHSRKIIFEQEKKEKKKNCC